ncbi:MAG: lecithin retinol acyltransferase family protein [Planctomycetota bacterium]
MAVGERLEVRRWLAGSAVAYWHHGIDMGDGTVVHARPHDFRNPFGGGSVVRTSLAEFADGEVVRTTSGPAAAFPPEEVARRAAALVGRQGYCPVVANCEHFASWCATGESRSRQVEAVVRRVVTVAATVVAGIVALRGGRSLARL